jgi:hypothetical protein
MGIAAAMTVATLLAAPATAGTLTGGTSQPGNREIRIEVEPRGPVTSVSFDWIANCHKGGAIRSTTDAGELNRASRAQFGDSFRGSVREGRRTIKLRYVLTGKRDSRKGGYFGTFRLSARYVGRSKPVKGTCRTRLVRWKARGGKRG